MTTLTKLDTTASIVQFTAEDCDQLLITGMHSVREAILGYTQLGLKQEEISERVRGLGLKASLPTIKRHVASLRQEGLLPAVEPSQSADAVRQRKHRASVTTAQNDPLSQIQQSDVIDVVVSQQPQSVAEELEQIYLTFEQIVLKRHREIKENTDAINQVKALVSIARSYRLLGE